MTFVDYGTGGLNTTHLYDEDPDDPGVADLIGRLVEIQRGGGTFEYRYDHFGRVTQDGQLTFGYDDNGNRTTVGYPGSVTATYEFDGVDRQRTLSVQAGSSQNVITDTTYLPSGPLANLTFGNTGTPLVETRAHDERYFPLGIDLTGVSMLLDWAYTTDGVGNVMSIADGVDPASSRQIDSVLRNTDSEVKVPRSGGESGGRKVVTNVLRLNTTEPTVVESGSLRRRPLERAER